MATMAENLTGGAAHGASGLAGRNSGQAFIPTFTGEVTTITINVRKSSVPTGSLKLKLHADDGTGKPGALLATSDGVDVTTFGTSFAPQAFTFSVTPPTLTLNVTYLWVTDVSDVVYPGGTLFYEGTINNSNPYTSADAVYTTTDGVVWTIYPNNDLVFTVEGDVPPPEYTEVNLDIPAIKETIQSILQSANTTTGSPIDLSRNLETRLVEVFKINPAKVMQSGNVFPCLTVWCDNKAIEPIDIVRDQAIGKRKADLTLMIAGLVWSPFSTDGTEDPADDECEYLMENLEEVLRSNPTLSNTVDWQVPNQVTYHSAPYDESAHMRVGLMTLRVRKLY